MEPTGTHTGPPDFIGVGTQRSGTTWWFGLLLQHPQIRISRYGNKELHFLTRISGRPMTDADVASYHDRFLRAEGEIVGEWTPRYMHDFWVPRLIRRAAPEAKLLILFRDPLERLRSGVPKEIDRDPEEPLPDVVADAIERGRYATQLKRLRAEHPDAKTLILQYEQCVRDPSHFYRRTLEFLGADTSQPLPDFEKRRGKSQASNKKELWDDFVEAVRPMLEEEALELARIAPEIDLSLWPNFAHLAGARAEDSSAAVR